MNGVRVLRVTCWPCGEDQEQPVEALIVVEQPDGSLLLMFACEGCLSGFQRVSHPSPRAAVLACGADVRRALPDRPAPTLLGTPPVRPDAYPRRPPPLTRLARLVADRFTTNPDR